MTDDYLWNKTGDDADIEQIESTLGVFRYEMTEPPSIAEIELAASRPSFWDLRFILVPAVGLCVAIVVAIGIWLGVPRNEVVLNDIAPTNQVNETIANVESASSITESNAPTAPSIYSPKKNLASLTFRRARPSTSIAKARLPKQHVPELTPEEKYAYDKLRLALAITGSKLKMVQDKANGLEADKYDRDYKK